jgi:YjbE family integral membrane protein
MDLGSPQFWLAALEIVVINILLSGDNAVVIALACRNLPPRQRRWGVIWGAVGAIVLRIILTFFAVSLLQLSWLKMIGGVLLVWIGIKLIAEEDGEGGHDVQGSDRMLAAIRTVVIADLVMSIDNVLGVAAAARGNLLLLIFGLVVSVPLVIGGAQLIMRLIERFPILIVAGGGLLGFVAGELIVDDSAIVDWVHAHAAWLTWAAPLIGIALVVGPAKWLEARRTKARG